MGCITGSKLNDQAVIITDKIKTISAMLDSGCEEPLKAVLYNKRERLRNECNRLLKEAYREMY